MTARSGQTKTSVPPMQKIRKPLPPLNALKAFEAVARLGSVTHAALELNVTPSAVSQQIRILEKHIGHKLFDKNRSQMTLLDAGSRAFENISSALDLIARAFQIKDAPDNRVAISILPSFAQRWLMPRMSALLGEYPDLDLHVDPSPRLVDFSRESFDLAIRYGRGIYPPGPPGMDRLFAERFQAVCAPSIKKRVEENIGRGRFGDINFICDTGMQDGEPVTWANWMEKQGFPSTMPARQMVCTDASMSIDMAINGNGLLLGRHALIQSQLAQKTLVALDAQALDSDLAYYLVYPSLAGLSRKARQVRDWILKQGREFRASHGLNS